MSHCVASYAHACVSGRTSIWSLGLQRVEGDEVKVRRSWVTIEVANATRTIVQARGRANRKPDATARAAMKRWAQAAQLAIADWV